MTSLPTFIVVTGPAGVGKTTLAHELARAVGCPAICRDEIKEGMVHATPGFVPGPGDELTVRARPVFFGILGLLVRAGVTTVAEAAFSGQVWRAGLEPFRDLAHIRVVHCVADPDVARARVLRRWQENPVRRAHADHGPHGPAAGAAGGEFSGLCLDAPWMEVDTTGGYTPGLDEIMAFLNDRA